MKHFFLLIRPVAVFLFTANSSFGQNKNRSDGAIRLFEPVPSAFDLATQIIEASGIADSKANPGFLWVHEDSGNPPQLHLLSHNGKKKKTIYLKNAANRDWEDMALANGPLPERKYIYLGEIGDNNAVHGEVSFYRFEEPSFTADTITEYDVIRFKYEDGPRDAEAFLVDNDSRDIFIITKREKKSRVYQLIYPYRLSEINEARFVLELSYSGVVSAAISADAKEIIIKTYSRLFYYTRMPGQTIPEALQRQYLPLDYQIEPQGEAVCFSSDSSGFYTLSEKRMSLWQKLYFYKRK